MVEYSPKYWNKEGKYQKEFDILYKKYIPDVGDKIRTGNKEATTALQKLRTTSKKYYRFFNDGDSFQLNGKYYSNSRYASDKELKMLDEAIDVIILRAWKKTKGATLPSYSVETTYLKY